MHTSPSHLEGVFLYWVKVVTSLAGDRVKDWRRRSDGLLLRRDVTSQAESDSYGGMHYSEHYGLRLLSVIPER